MKFYLLIILCLITNACGMPETPSFAGLSTNYNEGSNTNSAGTNTTSASTSNTHSSSSGSSSGNLTPTSSRNNTNPSSSSSNSDSTSTSNSNPITESRPSAEQNNSATEVAAISNSENFLMIHEILYDASESDSDGNEFIELYGSPQMDISGYQILIINGSDGEILDTLNLPQGARTRADGIYLIADLRTNSSNSSNILHADFMDNFDPQNGPDAIQILSPQGELKDSLAYGEGVVANASNGLALGEGHAAADVASGHSLSRNAGNDTQDNAHDFHDLETPSPGSL